MEPLLPSEVARLVYGYLEEQKCTKAAQIFLESCSHLSECLDALKNGRRISTRVFGHSLMDILDDHCDTYLLVAERSQHLPDTTKAAIRQNHGLNIKIRTLLDSYQSSQPVPPGEGGQSQPCSLLLNVPPENIAASPMSEEFSASCHRPSKPISLGQCSPRYSTGTAVTKTTELSNAGSLKEIHLEPITISTDTTPLECLPGLPICDNNEPESSKQLEAATAAATATPDGKNQEQSLPSDGDLQKWYNSTLKKKTPHKRRRSVVSSQTTKTFKESQKEDNMTEFLPPSAFIQPMLDNIQLHEKIAETINRVLGTSSTPLCDGSAESSMESFSHELNAAIHSVVEQTQADPIFEQLMDDMFTIPGGSSEDTEEQTSSTSERHVSSDGEELDMTRKKAQSRRAQTENTVEVGEVSTMAVNGDGLSHGSGMMEPPAPWHIPVLTFPVAPLCSATPGTPAVGKAPTNRELNTPVHEEANLSQGAKERFLTGMEITPRKTLLGKVATGQTVKIDEPPLKARLRSARKKADVVETVVTETPGSSGGHVLNTVEGKEPCSWSLDVQNAEAIRSIVDASPTSGQSKTRKQDQEQCYIINENVCVEVSSEVQEAISSSLSLAQSTISKDVIQLATTDNTTHHAFSVPVATQTYMPSQVQTSSVTSSQIHSVPTSVQSYLVLNDQQQISKPCSQGPEVTEAAALVTLATTAASLPPVQLHTSMAMENSKIVMLHTEALQGTIPQPIILPPQNIFLPEHGAYIPLLTRNQHPKRQENRPVHIAPKLLPFEDPEKVYMRNVKRRMSRAGKPKLRYGRSMLPDRKIKPQEELEVVDEGKLINISAMQVPASQSIAIVEVGPEGDTLSVQHKPEVLSPGKAAISMPSISPLQLLPQAPAAAIFVSTDKASVLTTHPTAGSLAEPTKSISADKDTAGPSCAKDISPSVQHTSVVRASHNPRRQSLSTPRRDRSHVRTLDFSTPPRSAMPRRAHTSPKGRAKQQQISPKTASKLSKANLIVRAGLFRSPSPGSTENAAQANKKKRSKQNATLQLAKSKEINPVEQATTQQINPPASIAAALQDVSQNLVPESQVSSSNLHSLPVSELQGSYQSSSINGDGNAAAETISSSVIIESPELPAVNPHSFPSPPSPVSAVPTGIATRTPGGPQVTRSCWDKVTGMDLILGSPQTPDTPSPSQPVVHQKKAPREWDAEWRDLICQQTDDTRRDSAEKACSSTLKSTKKIARRSSSEVPEHSRRRSRKLRIASQDSSSVDSSSKQITEQEPSSGEDFESSKAKDRKRSERNLAVQIIKNQKNVTTLTNINYLDKGLQNINTRKVQNGQKAVLKTVGARKDTILTENAASISTKNKKNISGSQINNSIDQRESVGTTMGLGSISVNVDQPQQGKETFPPVKKIVIQSPRTVSKHIVIRNEIHVDASIKSPRRAFDLNHILAVAPPCFITPRKIDEPSTSTQEETPLTKLLREQPVHELTVIDTPVFPPTPNFELTTNQCVSPPSPNESPYYPPPRDNYEAQSLSETDSLHIDLMPEETQYGDTPAPEMSSVLSTLVAKKQTQSVRKSARIKTRKEKHKSFKCTCCSEESSNSDTKKQCTVLHSKTNTECPTQSTSIQQLLHAEQSRIGLKNKPKSTQKKSKNKRNSHIRGVEPDEDPPKKMVTLKSHNKSQSPIELETVSLTGEDFGKKSPNSSSSPQPPLPNSPYRCAPSPPSPIIQNFNIEEEINANNTNSIRKKDIHFRNLLEERKQRVLSNLKRDFSKKDLPVVHLRAGGSSQVKAGRMRDARGKVRQQIRQKPRQTKDPTKKDKGKSASVLKSSTSNKKNGSIVPSNKEQKKAVHINSDLLIQEQNKPIYKYAVHGELSVDKIKEPIGETLKICKETSTLMPVHIESDGIKESFCSSDAAASSSDPEQLRIVESSPSISANTSPGSVQEKWMKESFCASETAGSSPDPERLRIVESSPSISANTSPGSVREKWFKESFCTSDAAASSSDPERLRIVESSPSISANTSPGSVREKWMKESFCASETAGSSPDPERLRIVESSPSISLNTSLGSVQDEESEPEPMTATTTKFNSIPKTTRVSSNKFHTPRKCVSVDEIANRLRGVVGSSDDEEMPALVLRDTPIKSSSPVLDPKYIKTKLKNVEYCNILEQLEMSPTELRYQPIHDKTINSENLLHSKYLGQQEASPTELGYLLANGEISVEKLQKNHISNHFNDAALMSLNSSKISDKQDESTLVKQSNESSAYESGVVSLSGGKKKNSELIKNVAAGMLPVTEQNNEHEKHEAFNCPVIVLSNSPAACNVSEEHKCKPLMCAESLQSSKNKEKSIQELNALEIRNRTKVLEPPLQDEDRKSVQEEISMFHLSRGIHTVVETSDEVTKDQQPSKCLETNILEQQNVTHTEACNQELENQSSITIENTATEEVVEEDEHKNILNSTDRFVSPSGKESFPFSATDELSEQQKTESVESGAHQKSPSKIVNIENLKSDPFIATEDADLLPTTHVEEILYNNCLHDASFEQDDHNKYDITSEAKPVARQGHTKVGYYRMKYEKDELHCPDNSLHSSKLKNLTVTLLVDEEDGGEARTQEVTLSYTPAVELFALKPKTAATVSQSTILHHSLPQRYRDDKSPNRSHYPRHRYTSHAHLFRRSRSPKTKKSNQHFKETNRAEKKCHRHNYYSSRHSSPTSDSSRSRSGSTHDSQVTSRKQNFSHDRRRQNRSSIYRENYKNQDKKHSERIKRHGNISHRRTSVKEPYLKRRSFSSSAESLHISTQPVRNVKRRRNASPASSTDISSPERTQPISRASVKPHRRSSRERASEPRIPDSELLAEDDLMTYALVGSVRVPEPNSFVLHPESRSLSPPPPMTRVPSFSPSFRGHISCSHSLPLKKRRGHSQDINTPALHVDFHRSFQERSVKPITSEWLKKPSPALRNSSPAATLESTSNGVAHESSSGAVAHETSNGAVPH